jgi:hypothetical protein
MNLTIARLSCTQSMMLLSILTRAYPVLGLSNHNTISN